MSDYEAQRRRIMRRGSSPGEAIVGFTKRLQVNRILDSPSLKYITIGDDIENTPCIVSNENTYIKRRFLLLPDREIENGEYIHYQDFVYLVTDVTRDDIYPQAFGEFCSETFKIEAGTIREQVGTDSYGRPIYEEVTIYEEVPCTYTTKAYSAAENAPIPLPDGVVDIKIPYFKDLLVKPNYITEYWGEKYQVTTVSYEHVFKEKGFVEIRLQRVVKEKND